MPDRRIIVLSPRYDGIIDEARAAIDGPSKGAFSHCYATIASTSMTSNCFNNALAAALNVRDRLGITHLGMVHADIDAPPGWADTLLDQMETGGYSLISAVVPIKSDEGRTSTAVGSRAEPWAIRRYVMVGEHRRYGMTFGTRAVARADDEFLMVNTGLWLADFRMPFWEEFGGFRFFTDLHRGEDGRWGARMRPEDWEMSRDLDAAGIPYAASFAVRVGHRGPHTWWNRGA